MHVVVLIEPIAQNTSRAAQSAHLDALTAPALLAVEDGEGGPADLAFGGLADGPCARRSVQEQSLTYLKPTSYPTIRIRIPARMQAPRITSEMHDRQPLALEVTPIHPIPFLVVVDPPTARRFDARDLQLDTDQSDR